ncbi:MAG: nickel pincer cofactor biosynthesis protein LarB [Candidatus Obscuribacterales bacterium]|nr:nickel pincer cofactor biosynthesis protein LarB [Candidatus Obscuribacterales bacterium]
MQEERLKQLLQKVASSELTIEAAMHELKHLPFEDLGFAKIDHHRQLRQGHAEVIYSPGKTAAQIVEISGRLKPHAALRLATRASAEQAAAILELDPEAVYDPDAQMLIWGEFPAIDSALGSVAILTAGTADLKLAAEAELTLKAAAIKSVLISDVGVAGLHRIVKHLDTLSRADVCIVIAGMDGALPSVVGGLLKAPVIACPCSSGYGAAFEGLAALLTMLNSCAAGLTVVNIDNGFGAAMAAIRILQCRKGL